MSGTQWVSHPVFFDAPFSWGHTGACAPLGANVWHPMGVTLFFLGYTHFKTKKQVHARHWVPMSGTQWVSHPVFFDAPFSWGHTGACAPLGANVWHPMGVTLFFLGYTHFKTKKQVHARHWVPMSGTQWVSHPVFFDAPFSWGHTGALPMSGTQWVSHHFLGIHTF